jgi:hypothetical protein
MDDEDIIKKRLKKLKQRFPEMDEEQIQRELFPLGKDEVKPKVVKKKKAE